LPARHAAGRRHDLPDLARSGAGASSAAAIISPRGGSTHYHHAEGLLDHARYFGDQGVEAAASALAAVTNIAGKRRC
jgi:hypothetical protein